MSEETFIPKSRKKKKASGPSTGAFSPDPTSMFLAALKQGAPAEETPEENLELEGRAEDIVFDQSLAVVKPWQAGQREEEDELSIEPSYSEEITEAEESALCEPLPGIQASDEDEGELADHGQETDSEAPGPDQSQQTRSNGALENEIWQKAQSLVRNANTRSGQFSAQTGNDKTASDSSSRKAGDEREVWDEDHGRMYELLTGKKLANKAEPYSNGVEKQIRTKYLAAADTGQFEALPNKRPHDVREMFKPDTPILGRMGLFAKQLDAVHKSPVLVMAPLLCVVVVSFLISNFAFAEKELIDGRKKIDDKDYDGALAVLNDANIRNPFRSEIYYQRGRACNKKGDLKKAVQNYSFCLLIDQGNVSALDHRASLNMRLGNFEDAYKDYLRLFAIEPAPDASKIYRYKNAAQSAKAKGLFQEALKYYEKALKVRGDDYESLTGRIFCESLLSHHDRAIELCNQLIARNPQKLDAYVNRGWCYMQAHKEGDAMRDFNYVLAIDRHNARAHMNRGHVLWKNGALKEATEAYDMAVRNDPQLIEARSARAWALLNSKPKQSLDDMIIVTRCPPYSTNSSSWATRAQLELRTGKYSQAYSSFEKAISLSPDEAELYVGAAEALSGLRKYKEAVDYCDKAMARNPFLALAYAVRGTAHQQQNNPISALADLSQALQIDPKSADALLWRAQFFMAQKRNYDAKEDLTALVKAHPDHAEGRKLLVKVSSMLPRFASGSGVVSADELAKYANVPFEELVSGGYAALQKGSMETAVNMLTAAARKRPTDVAVRRYLAHALLRENPATAVLQFEALKAAGQLTDDDANALNQALSLAACGNLGESASVAKSFKVLEKNSGDPEACYKLATLYAAAGLRSRAALYCSQGLRNSTEPLERKRFQDLMTSLHQMPAPASQKADIGG
ncbi:MAG TPA: tetratricopeptide repeat protein [Candidatus Obscuribacterales bacterium]